MAAKAPATRRGRSAKAALSRDAVLDAALEIVRKEGIEALTMRRLATALDTGAASLYVYFANRDELLSAAFEQVTAQIELPEIDPERWREQALDLLVRSREAMERYPGIARVALAKVPTGDSSVRGADRLMGLLKAGGFDDATVAWAGDVLFLYVTAAALENTVRIEDPQQSIDDLSERFLNLPPEQFPHMAALGSALVGGTAEERYRFGLELMLNGLLNTPPPQPAAD